VENGDLNWILPNKMLTLASPNDQGDDKNFNGKLRPEMYIPYFKKNDVGLVIRLNHPLYDRTKFINNGIQHKDL